MSGLAFARVVLALSVCSAPLAAAAHETAGRNHDGRQPANSGASAGYAFALPEPGSYRLPPIRPAGRGEVLDEKGTRRQLTDLLQGRITVLAFMYTQCGDVCPTAMLQMSLLQDRAAQDRTLSGRVQLVSMSFDPDHDTPAVMADEASHWRSDRAEAPEWLFLTAPDHAALAPVLAAYDQTVDPNPAPGAASGSLRHLFRAFLIDPLGRIRNIYSIDFLDPELMLNDIRTLSIEREPNDRTPSGTR